MSRCKLGQSLPIPDIRNARALAQPPAVASCHGQGAGTRLKCSTYRRGAVLGGGEAYCLADFGARAQMER